MKKKNPICTILWTDAAYSFESKLPEETPHPHLTSGFVIETNDLFTFIATNVSYNKETSMITPIDGMVIPSKAIIEFRKIGNYNE